jgi:ABC-type multidrug transport system fused ATPase/permease subunit
MMLVEIFKQFRWKISLALSFVLVEKLAWIIEPTLFGKVIDAMIDALSDPSHPSPVQPIAIWIGAFVLNSGMGTLHRSVGERIYLNMYIAITTRITTLAKQVGDSVSRTAGRAELSREFISFFQYRLPEMIEQGFDIIGAVVALAFFDYRLAVACLVLGIPLSLFGRTYNRKVLSLQRSIHDGKENAYGVFSTLDPDQVRLYYSDMARHQQKIANLGAWNFGILRIFLLGIFLVVLYIAIDIDDFTTGNIYSIVAYLWTFVGSSEYIPEQLESWASIKDISRRIRFENK